MQSGAHNLSFRGCVKLTILDSAKLRRTPPAPRRNGLRSRAIRLGSLVLAVVAIALLNGARGAFGQSMMASSPCDLKLSGTPSRIHVENSGMSCGEIRQLLIPVPEGVVVFPIYEGSGKVLRCRNYPTRARPLITRCASGSRHFTVKARS